MSRYIKAKYPIIRKAPIMCLVQIISPVFEARYKYLSCKCLDDTEGRGVFITQSQKKLHPICSTGF